MVEIFTGWFSGLRAVLEILYYLSAVVLAFLAVIGLRQLKIARCDIAIRSKREAASLAALQHEKFVEKVFPLSNRLAAAMKQHGVLRANEELKPLTISFSEEASK